MVLETINHFCVGGWDTDTCILEAESEAEAALIWTASKALLFHLSVGPFIHLAVDHSISPSYAYKQVQWSLGYISRVTRATYLYHFIALILGH